jgi:hypothetical protein
MDAIPVVVACQAREGCGRVQEVAKPLAGTQLSGQRGNLIASDEY